MENHSTDVMIVWKKRKNVFIVTILNSIITVNFTNIIYYYMYTLYKRPVFFLNCQRLSRSANLDPNERLHLGKFLTERYNFKTYNSSL